MLYKLIIFLTVLVAILLIGIVLIQKSKGGGLSSQFGSAGSVMGVRQTNDFLPKATWTLVGALVVLSIISVYTMPRQTQSDELRTKPVQTAAPVEIPSGQFDTPVAMPLEAPAATPAEGE